MSIFTCVVEAGSFSGAARRLGLPKSTVSRRVSELEQALDARLLHRTTRRVTLTDVGRTYARYAERAVAELEAGAHAVAALEEAPRGLLRVTAPLALPFLPRLCAEYLRRYPEVRLELSCTDRVVDLVDEGFDLAIRAGHLAPSSLIARKLTSWDGLLVASPLYLEAHGVPRTPDGLREHECVAFGDPGRPWVLESDGREARVEVKGRVVTNDLGLVAEVARAGLGVAMLPAFRCEEELTDGRLVRVLEQWRGPAVPLSALYPSARQLSPKVRAFVEQLREGLATR